MNNKILLHTKNEKIEKIEKNDLIEFINELHMNHFALCYEHDLYKCNYNTIDDLYNTIKNIKNVVSKFDYYDTFYLYSNNDCECVILSHEFDDFVIYDIYDDDFCNINEYNFEFYDEITMYKYIINELNEQMKINEYKNTIIEN